MFLILCLTGPSICHRGASLSQFWGLFHSSGPHYWPRGQACFIFISVKAMNKDTFKQIIKQKTKSSVTLHHSNTSYSIECFSVFPLVYPFIERRPIKMYFSRYLKFSYLSYFISCLCFSPTLYLLETPSLFS